jgi:hypothetical protein
MDSIRVTYRSSSGVTPEEEVRALAAAYRLALRAHAKEKEGAGQGTPKDGAMEVENAHTAERTIHK